MNNIRIIAALELLLSQSISCEFYGSFNTIEMLFLRNWCCMEKDTEFIIFFYIRNYDLFIPHSIYVGMVIIKVFVLTKYTCSKQFGIGFQCILLYTLYVFLWVTIVSAKRSRNAYWNYIISQTFKECLPKLHYKIDFIIYMISNHSCQIWRFVDILTILSSKNVILTIWRLMPCPYFYDFWKLKIYIIFFTLVH